MIYNIVLSAFVSRTRLLTQCKKKYNVLLPLLAFHVHGPRVLVRVEVRVRQLARPARWPAESLPMGL